MTISENTEEKLSLDDLLQMPIEDLNPAQLNIVLEYRAKIAVNAAYYAEKLAADERDRQATLKVLQEAKANANSAFEYAKSMVVPLEVVNE